MAEIASSLKRGGACFRQNLDRSLSMGSSGGGFLTAFSVEENFFASFHLPCRRKCQDKISARRRGFEKSFCTAPALTTGALDSMHFRRVFI